MISVNEDALICDLAETYGILAYRALPATLLAALSVGLRDDSRIKMQMSGAKATRTEIMIASAVDRLSYILWTKTEDGIKNRHRPKSMVSILLGETVENDVSGFSTADEYEAEWVRITRARGGN